MSNFLMHLISYIFVACTLAGATIVFGGGVWAVKEFFKGFLSVFVGTIKADTICDEYFPYALSGLLILLLWLTNVRC